MLDDSDKNSSIPCTEIVLYKDLDDDRYLSWEQFKAFINFLPAFRRDQAFFLFLGITGFRPVEAARARIDNLDFTNRQEPRIINKITKYKTERYFDEKGSVVSIRHVRRKSRLIPLWVRDYFEEYIRRNWQLMADNLLFPSLLHHRIVSTQSWSWTLSKYRHRMVTTNPIKYSWANDVIYEQIGGYGKMQDKVLSDKRINKIHRLSLYAFRKSRATWYAMSCMEKGIQDILLCTAHFMGHSGKSTNTTYRYIKRLVADRLDGSVMPLIPPNLNENFIGVDNPSDEIDEITQKIANNPKIRNIIKEIIAAQEKALHDAKFK